MSALPVHRAFSGASAHGLRSLPRDGTGSVPSAMTQFRACVADATRLLDEAARFLDTATTEAGAHAAANRDHDARVQAIGDVQNAKRNLVALEAKLVYAEHQAGTWAGRGDKDLPTHLGRVTREGSREGRQTVARAITLNDLPSVAEGFKDGSLTTSHVDVVAKALLNAPEHVAKELASQVVQAKLVADAKTQAPVQFAKNVDALVAVLSPQAVEDRHQAQFRGRYLSVTDTPEGTFLKGFLDRVSGHRVKLALEVLMHRPTKHDVDDAGELFTGGQRTADALVVMADTVLNDGQHKTGALLRPHVSVVVEESTWKALRSPRPASAPASAPVDTADGGSSRGGGNPNGTQKVGSSQVIFDGEPSTSPVVVLPPPGSAADVAARLEGVAPVLDDTGRVIPPSEVGRILCDCSLTRMVMTSGSELLDLGRSHRLYTNGQRRAVNLRDQGCAWQGCEVPVRWCDVHHIQWWSEGGGTDFDNALSVCSFHHGQIHSRNLTVTRYWKGELALESPDASDPWDNSILDSGREKEREYLGQGRSLVKTQVNKTQVGATQMSGAQVDATPVGTASAPTLSGVGYVMTDPHGRVISRT